MATAVLPPEEEFADLVPREGSVVWRKAGDSRILSSAGYALLLQVAHPTVGAGVDQHSDFASDPWGRLLRTLDYVHGTIYGGPAMAGEIGRRVRNLHKNIKGSKPDGQPYHALEPEAYAWVHATLASSIIDGHRLTGSPLTRPEEEEFWQQWRRLGRLVGVRYRDLPEDWADFRPYFDKVVEDELEDTRMVHVVYGTLAKPAPPEIPGLHPALWKVMRRPMGRNMQLVTAGLLPPVLRERFGFEWTPGQERTLRVLARASRAGGPLMFGPLKQFGPYYVRWRRAALERGDVASSRIAARLQAKAQDAA